jgi:hypothetical protein
MRILIVLAFVCVCFAASYAQAQRCLSYEPATVTLEGNVYSKSFPGPPNFESNGGGDQRMQYWILRLPKLICVDGGHDDVDVRELNIREVQLVFEDDGYYKKYRSLVGKRTRFRVVGTLYHQHTGHHVRKVLINVQRLVPAGS